MLPWLGPSAPPPLPGPPAPVLEFSLGLGLWFWGPPWLHPPALASCCDTAQVGSASPELTILPEAAAPAALLPGVLGVVLEELGSQPLRLLQVQEQSREAADPAISVEHGGRAEPVHGAS